jgi:hypothetical protein
MSTNQIIGAVVNQHNNTVSITVNGVELAVVDLKFGGSLNNRFDGLIVESVEYKSDNYGEQFRGSVSLSSTSASIHWLPESVVKVLKSTVHDVPVD